MTDVKITLPLIPLRGVVAFPSTALTFDVGRERSIAAVNKALDGDKRVYAVAQKDLTTELPQIEDMYSMGTIITIKQIMRLPDGVMRVFADGVCRALLVDTKEIPDYTIAGVFTVDEQDVPPNDAMNVTMRLLKKYSVQLVRVKNLNSSQRIIDLLRTEKKPNALCDLIAANLIEDIEDKQAILECVDAQLRLQSLLDLVTREIGLIGLERNINERTRARMEKANRDYFLREQINVIQDELGEDDDEDIMELRHRLAHSAISGEARDKTEKELKRLSKMTMHAPESVVSYNYVDTMLSLPWENTIVPNVDVAFARKVLEADHYGLNDVKERLIEYIGVMALSKEVRSPIICLVGPPGVGKTSIVKSVARALKRKFAKMSLGGVHDESELRGHRRTYIGAMPGRVVTSLQHCGSLAPVFLMDEIDKLAHDVHGDPASALLEILDPEQNAKFRDNFVDAPLDLSKVMFITTANSLDTIDRALLDRMEIIEIPSYTLDEKTQIAKRHLLPKQIVAHGMRKSHVKLPEAVIKKIIEGYTREAGVRELERILAKICRKSALKISENEDLHSVSVTAANLNDFLGAPRYIREDVTRENAVGVVNGLAWTQVGGEVMPVEAVMLDGSGRLELTGRLGEVMKESAQLAMSVARARLAPNGMNAEFFKNHDIHVHVPEGAVPKDGPSAGVALTCAVISAITGEKARADIAMTGEITLTGRVLPIGGVKEKLLSAYRMGIKNILLPRENAKDLEDIDEETRNDMNITLIDRVDEALEIVLVKAEA